jgi:4-amino-4-deoxy-L-arabinose transferase-like glycosyltransferase
MWFCPKFLSHRFSPWLTHLAVALLVFFFTFGLTVYRIDQAPDIFTDEIIYTRAGIRTAGEGALVWDSGEAFLIHPPLYFIVEAVYFTFAGEPRTTLYSAGDIFASVYGARHINALLAGLTAVILYFFGKSLHSNKLGLLLALIFSLDPFILRINRRAMLETMAGMLVLAGMALYFVHSKPNPTRRNSSWGWVQSLVPKPGLIIAALIFGLALLTKELVFIGLTAVIVFGILQFLYHLIVTRSKSGRSHIFEIFIHTIYPAALVTSIAGLTYLLYPLWALYLGEWSIFSQEKTLGFKRLLGLVQLTGWNRPGFSLLDFMFQRLTDYGSSYLLIALGGVATLVLILWTRHLRPARFLIAWGLTLYPFFAFLAFAGSGNDQFFYFLVVPAIVLVGYALIKIPEIIEARLSPKFMPRFVERIQTRGQNWAILLFLLVIIFFSLFRWWTNYGVGVDNGYAQFTRYVQTNLPPQEPLNSSGDPVKFHYFFPDRPIVAALTPYEAVTSGVEYYAITPKDFRYRYGKSNPEFAAFVQDMGELIYTVNGDSYGDIYLYSIDLPGEPIQVVEPENSDGRHWRSYQVAKSGFVGTLVIALLGWFTLWGFLALVFYRLHRISPTDVPHRQKIPEDMEFSPISLIKSWFT